MADAFDRHYAALMKALDEIIPLLRARGETLFLEWFENDRARIADGKTRALQHLLSAYGGTGSINDLAIDDRGKDRKLAQLRSEIWEHADAMLRDLDEGHFYIGTR